MSKLFRLFSILLLMNGMYFIPVTSAFAEGETDTDKNEIDISISTSNGLFNVSNMKPGDWAPRTIIVQNSGSEDFVYEMQVKNSGEGKLFNELQLEVTAEDKELYQGNLAEFTSLSARNLTSGKGENLDITIRFPEHLGNDFQGLQSEFVITFTAEGKDNEADQAIITGQIDSGVLSSVGFSPPTTPTSLFYLMLFSTVLVVGGIVLMIIRHYRRTSLL